MKTGRFRSTIFIAVLALAIIGIAAAWTYLRGRGSADRLVLSGTIEADEIHVGSTRNGPRKQEIDGARADLKATEADLEAAKATLERIARLVRDGVQSRQEYDNAKSAFDRTSAQREAARQKLDLLLAGTKRGD